MGRLARPEKTVRLAAPEAKVAVETMLDSILVTGGSLPGGEVATEVKVDRAGVVAIVATEVKSGLAGLCPQRSNGTQAIRSGSSGFRTD
jgi:hypothetical protein